jgi:hypothetical protein
MLARAWDKYSASPVFGQQQISAIRIFCSIRSKADVPFAGEDSFMSKSALASYWRAITMAPVLVSRFAGRMPSASPEEKSAPHLID